MRLIVSPLAEADITSAWRWYQIKWDVLGQRFIAQLDITLTRVSTRPELYPVVYRDIHRALLNKFPYAVYYQLINHQIVIIAVLHQSQSSRHLQQRSIHPLDLDKL